MEQTAGTTRRPAPRSVRPANWSRSFRAGAPARPRRAQARPGGDGAEGQADGHRVGAFAGSGVIALYAVGCLLACAIIAISGAVAAWLAALIVGAALLAVSGIAALVGKSRLREGTPPVPKEAIGSVQADVHEVKEKAHR